MNKILKKTAGLAAVVSGAWLFQGCIDEEVPTSVATDGQITQSGDVTNRLINGLGAIMVENATSGVDSEYDWGYPCQMFIRDVLCEDMTVSSSTYDRFLWVSDGEDLSIYCEYAYYFYYTLIQNANNIIGKYDKADATDEERHAVGMAKAYRALAYLDLAREYEYKKTGIEELDQKAEASNIYGLSVPLVTDATTKAQARNNPRAPFYRMYKFIMNDLDKAEAALADYDRDEDDKDKPDINVVYGLKARLWLEMASRFDQNADDLAAQVSHDADDDGYSPLGITSAADCYAKAAEYARKAITSGEFSPITKDQWFDKNEAFNTANQGWMWKACLGSKSQIGYWYYSWMGFVNSESSRYTWARYYGHTYGTSYSAFRCIGSHLYSQISDDDWRKKTWVDPLDAGEPAIPDGYSTLLKNDEWKELSAYASLKFHGGSGNLDDYNVFLLCDVPLMRVEEMHFIYAEAVAHTDGLPAGVSALEHFVNTYRYEDASSPYRCGAADMDSFIDELLVQKRIEFWGEGIVLFDYKRLTKPIDRSRSGNVPLSYQLVSKSGYVFAGMNYYIPQDEQNQNSSCVLNPDPSGKVSAE